MSNPITPRLTVDQFVAQMTDQMAQIARTLSAWSQAEPRTIQDLEPHAVRLLHDLGTALLSGLCILAAQQPTPDIPCPCGAQARMLRMRLATVTTVLGDINHRFNQRPFGIGQVGRVAARPQVWYDHRYLRVSSAANVVVPAV
jgi:hypothetical protein